MLFVCTVALSVFYFRFFFFFSDKEPLDTLDQRPMSLVIATRNEHDQLRQNLPFFMNQNYPNLEVVVVIDDSDTEMRYIMQEFEKQYSNLKVVCFEWSRNFFVNPRFAESVGIKSAAHDRILLSNITTRPSSPEWVARMSKALSGNKKIVIGYHSITLKPSFINAFIRFKSFFYAMRYLSAAVSGKPFTANSKNLAFERELFYETRSIAQFYNVNTGEEDMFVNKAATKTNTAVVVHQDAFVKAQLEPTFSDWFEKRTRHRVLFKEFKTVNRLGLVLYNWFTALFYIISGVILACFLMPENEIFTANMDLLIVAGSIFILKFLAQGIVFKQMMNLFKERGFLLLIPAFELMMLVLQPILLLTGLFTKRITWK
jgi:glycosyltransferase involved in cell wall biosynthesis